MHEDALRTLRQRIDDPEVAVSEFHFMAYAGMATSPGGSSTKKGLETLHAVVDRRCHSWISSTFGRRRVLVVVAEATGGSPETYNS